MSRSGSWVNDEGFLNSTSLYCDLLTDWWPDGQTLPVRYYATIPCGRYDTGYQTFDTAFAVQRTGAPDCMMSNVTPQWWIFNLARGDSAAPQRLECRSISPML